jgi:hypothetical protein
MAIQIRGVQIQDGSIASGKLAISGATFDFSSGTLRAGTPSASTDVANKAYVDGQLPDSFSGGDGIAIDASGDPDVISVDLATNSGLAFSSNKLIVNLDGSTLALGAGGLSVGNAISNANIANDAAIAKSKLGALGITNSDVDNSAAIAISKLAASTISGKSLGTNLSDLTDGNGIADFTFNGSSAGVIALDLDGSTLSVGADGVKIADDGVGNAQIADDAVQNAQIQNGAVSIAKLGFQARVDQPSTSGGSTSAFNLSNQVAPEFESMVLVYRNGLLQKIVASSPSDDSEYTVSTAGSTTTVTFGANISASDTLDIRYFA